MLGLERSDQLLSRLLEAVSMGGNPPPPWEPTQNPEKPHCVGQEVCAGKLKGAARGRRETCCRRAGGLSGKKPVTRLALSEAAQLRKTQRVPGLRMRSLPLPPPPGGALGLRC